MNDEDRVCAVAGLRFRVEGLASGRTSTALAVLSPCCDWPMNGVGETKCAACEQAYPYWGRSSISANVSPAALASWVCGALDSLTGVSPLQNEINASESISAFLVLVARYEAWVEEEERIFATW